MYCLFLVPDYINLNLLVDLWILLISVNGKTTIDDVKSFIDSLPTNDIPEVFGMDSSADLSFRIREAKRVLHYSALASARNLASNDSIATKDLINDAIIQSLVNKVPKKLPGTQYCLCSGTWAQLKYIECFYSFWTLRSRQVLHKHPVAIRKLFQERNKDF